MVLPVLDAQGKKIRVGDIAIYLGDKHSQEHRGVQVRVRDHSGKHPPLSVRVDDDLETPHDVDFDHHRWTWLAWVDPRSLSIVTPYTAEVP